MVKTLFNLIALYLLVKLFLFLAKIVISPFLSKQDSNNNVEKYGSPDVEKRWLTEKEINNLFTEKELDNLGYTIDDVKKVISWNAEVEKLIKKENSTKDEIMKIVSKNLRRMKHHELWVEKYRTLKPIYKGKGKFYVYQYKIHNQVMYIGKGTKISFSAVPYNRAADVWDHKHCRAYIDMIEVEILKCFEDEADALSYEIELIKRYGLKNLLNRRH